MQPLAEAGLDLLGALELRDSLSAKFGMELPATLTFDHPTASALAAHIALTTKPTMHMSTPWSKQLGRASPAERSSLGCEIAGLACRYPELGHGGGGPAVLDGGSGLGSFWATAAGSGDVQRTVPLQRWAIDDVYAPEMVLGKMSVSVR